MRGVMGPRMPSRVLGAALAIELYLQYRMHDVLGNWRPDTGSNALGGSLHSNLFTESIPQIVGLDPECSGCRTQCLGRRSPRNFATETVLHNALFGHGRQDARSSDWGLHSLRDLFIESALQNAGLGPKAPGAWSGAWGGTRH